MMSVRGASARARRLLKLYPPTWRERYGDEFVDFMEQSIASDPHNAKRTANIIYKSGKVRLSELGIVGPTLNESRASKVALGTATFLASIFAVFALFYWSSAMISWNSNPEVATGVAVSIWMGAVTVSTILLSFTLLAFASAIGICSYSCRWYSSLWWRLSTRRISTRGGPSRAAESSGRGLARS
jgi:hypothetical protein